MAIPAGNDVVAVVRITNGRHIFPIAFEYHGPHETGRTYASCNGSSWVDIGTNFSADIGLRLRVSNNLARGMVFLPLVMKN